MAITIQEAKRTAASIAVGDLLGYSEPPEGVEDNYPFNAVAYRKTLPKEWQAEVEDVIVYVYHHEQWPEGI